jgi:hypothetical protein
MFWTSFNVLRIVQVEIEAGSLNLSGHLVAPFGRRSDASEIVRSRAFMICKSHDYDDDNNNNNNMILFKISFD